MAELKTKVTRESVAGFISKLKDPKRRKECEALLTLMKRATKATPKMWGTSIVGFGEYHYKGASGREGDWFVTGFSPRATALTVYLIAGVARFESQLEKLGKHKVGKGCLYIRKLEDIDLKVLEQMVAKSYKLLTKKS